MGNKSSSKALSRPRSSTAPSVMEGLAETLPDLTPEPSPTSSPTDSEDSLGLERLVASRKLVDPNYMDKLRSWAAHRQMENLYRRLGGCPSFLEKSEDPFTLTFQRESLKETLQLLTFLEEHLETIKKRVELLDGQFHLKVTRKVPKYLRQVIESVLSYQAMVNQMSQVQVIRKPNPNSAHSSTHQTIDPEEVDPAELEEMEMLPENEEEEGSLETEGGDEEVVPAQEVVSAEPVALV